MKKWLLASVLVLVISVLAACGSKGSEEKAEGLLSDDKLVVGVTAGPHEEIVEKPYYVDKIVEKRIEAPPQIVEKKIRKSRYVEREVEQIVENRVPVEKIVHVEREKKVERPRYVE